MTEDNQGDLHTRFTVCVRSVSGGTHGTGILVDRRHVLTCAHVLAFAQGKTSANTPPDDTAVMIQLPIPRESHEPIEAIPIRNWPLFRGRAFGLTDIAILKIDDSMLPQGARPIDLGACATLRIDRAKCYGFGGAGDGRIIEFKLQGFNARGRIQCDDVFGQKRAKPGDSGAPVYDLLADGSAHLLGMLDARDRADEERQDADERTAQRADGSSAYAIPSKHLIEALRAAGVIPEQAAPLHDLEREEIENELTALFQEPLPGDRTWADLISLAVASWGASVGCDFEDLPYVSEDYPSGQAWDTLERTNSKSPVAPEVLYRAEKQLRLGATRDLTLEKRISKLRLRIMTHWTVGHEYAEQARMNAQKGGATKALTIYFYNNIGSGYQFEARRFYDKTPLGVKPEEGSEPVDLPWEDGPPNVIDFDCVNDLQKLAVAIDKQLDNVDYENCELEFVLPAPLLMSCRMGPEYWPVRSRNEPLGCIHPFVLRSKCGYLVEKPGSRMKQMKHWSAVWQSDVGSCDRAEPVFPSIFQTFGAGFLRRSALEQLTASGHGILFTDCAGLGVEHIENAVGLGISVALWPKHSASHQGFGASLSSGVGGSCKLKELSHVLRDLRESLAPDNLNDALFSVGLLMDNPHRVFRGKQDSESPRRKARVAC